MRTVDVIGVGIGPFNLGLAALLEPVPDVEAVFLEADPSFAWHPGLMLPGTTLQVPFLADLVTLADPTNPYSFLNYLRAKDRLYRFYFYERFHIPRREYDAYAGWVAGQLSTCRFGRQVESVSENDDGTWTVVARHHNRAHDDQPRDGSGHDGPQGTREEYRARSVVFGVGGRPAVPAVARGVVGDDVFHAGRYLGLREKAVGAEAVTVVGSGQSAGEVVADLLESGLDTGQSLDWFTRSDGFLPMEYSKLGLEHFTPDYTRHFHALPAGTRDRIRGGQDLLYKGLSAETSERIYDLLYAATITGDDPPVTYAARCELRAIEPSPRPGRRWRLTWWHRDEERAFARDTDVVVLATGYDPAPLPIPDGLIDRDRLGRPLIDADYRLSVRGQAPDRPGGLFIQNGDLHTHGIGAPDLGLGAHRNSVIVNALAGRTVYPISENTVFQRFGTAGLDHPGPA